MSVRVDYPLDYDTACERYGNPDHLRRWQDLGDAVAHRSGWHFDLANGGEPMWCFGAFGMALLVIFVNELGRYECFDYYADDSEFPGSVDEVLTWVDARETTALAKGRAPYELVKHDDWKLLGQMPLDLDVTYFDGYFSGSVRNIPGEAVLQPDLPSTVRAAGQLVSDHVGAPREKAATVKFRLHLDVDAASAVAP